MFTPDPSNFQKGDKVVLKEEVHVFGGKFSAGHLFTVVDQNYRGYDLEDGEGRFLREFPGTKLVRDRLSDVVADIAGDRSDRFQWQEGDVEVNPGGGSAETMDEPLAPNGRPSMSVLADQLGDALSGCHRALHNLAPKLENAEINDSEAQAAYEHATLLLRRWTLLRDGSSGWSKEAYMALPEASYKQIDAYMADALAFLKLPQTGHQEVAAMTASMVARYMAFQDGMRIP